MYFISGNRSCSRGDRRGGSSSRSDVALCACAWLLRVLVVSDCECDCCCCDCDLDYDSDYDCRSHFCTDQRSRRDVKLS